MGMLIALLILASLALVILDTEYRDAAWIDAALWGIGVFFLAEYVLRIWLADITHAGRRRPRWAYIRSFEGVVDLLAALPVLIGPVIQNAAALRALRLVRMSQLFKYRAVRDAVNSVWRALRLSWDELAFSLVLSLSLILFGATLMYFIEGPHQPETFGSIPRALWWAMATLTTVGYGDVYPVTPGGKAVASFVAIVGIAAVAMPAGILAAAFSDTRRVEEAVESAEAE